MPDHIAIILYQVINSFVFKSIRSNDADFKMVHKDPDDPAVQNAPAVF